MKNKFSYKSKRYFTAQMALKGFRLTEISRWAKQYLQTNSTIISEGLPCFSAVKEAGCCHISIVTGGGPQSVTKEEFTWINTLIAM